MNSITPFRKRRALVLGGLATVLACGVFATGAGAQEPLKIGFICTLSGPAGALGQGQSDAFMLAIEQTHGKLGGVPFPVIRNRSKERRLGNAGVRTYRPRGAPTNKK